jgi:hypothetical protein
MKLGKVQTLYKGNLYEVIGVAKHSETLRGNGCLQSFIPSRKEKTCGCDLKLCF